MGSPEPVGVAPGADLRTDVPRYRIYKDGMLADEVTNITPFWRDDLVAFLLGCSFTFEWALLDAGIPMRHIDEGKNVAMWKTSIACRPAGRFHGPMVVSMRPIPTQQVSKAVTTSARFPNAHGAPVQVGDPAAIGIADVTRPDWGFRRHSRRRGAGVLGVRGDAAGGGARLQAGVHDYPQPRGHMFITDLPNHMLAAL